VCRSLFDVYLEILETREVTVQVTPSGTRDPRGRYEKMSGELLTEDAGSGHVIGEDERLRVRRPALARGHRDSEAWEHVLALRAVPGSLPEGPTVESTDAPDDRARS
jgi:hypothetical protein